MSRSFGVVVALVVIGVAWSSGWSGAPTAPAAARPIAPVASADASLAHLLPAASGSEGWVNLSSSLPLSPPARMYASMAFDPQLGGVLLFGGVTYHTAIGANMTYNDSWLFANGTWSNITSRYAGAPEPRWAASLAWDPVDHYMVLFGGRADKAPPNNLPGFVNDTWAFSATTGWSRISSAQAPSPRGFAPITYDPAVSALLLYSGGDINFANGTLIAHNDTWEFSGGAWSNVTASAGVGPHQVTALSYDPSLGALLAAGIMANNSLCTPLRQTWVFNGTWNKLNQSVSGPPPGGAMAYDAAVGADVYTGGCVPVNHAPISLTWEFASDNWTNVTSTLTGSPSQTCCAALAYDPIEKVDLRFGGNRVLPTVRTGYDNYTYSFPVAPLTAQVTASALSGTVPLAVNFTSTPAGGAGTYTFSWALGDGSPTATTRDVNHTYTALGVYVVNYTVSDGHGRSYNRTLVVHVGTPLTLSVAASPTAGEAPLPVTFNASGLGGGFPPYTVSWSFGDGGVGTGSNTTYTYRTAGNWTATATLSDSVGDTLVKSIAVSVLAAVAASASASAPAGVAPFSVSFLGTATGGLAPYAYAWSFGDGGSATGATPSHTYASPGTYSAALVVTDAYARTAGATVAIVVVAPLAASSSASAPVGPAPLTVAFSSAPTGGLGPFTYAWNFGDGGTSTSASPTHSYTAPGNFTATVTIADSLGEVATSSQSVEVVGPLTISAAASVAAAVFPASVSFTASPGGGLGPYTYAWAFGDGASGTGAGTSHTFTAAGVFDASVTATDSLGQTASAHVTVTIVAPLSAALAASSASIELGQSVRLTATVSGGLAPATFTWTSVPTGCVGASSAQLNCTPTAAGTYTVTVEVVDGLHESVNASTTVTVSSPSGGGGSSGPFAGLTTPILIGLVVVLAIIAVLAFLLVQSARQSRRPPSHEAEPAPPREIEAPAPENPPPPT